MKTSHGWLCPVLADTAPNGSKLGAERPQVLPVDSTLSALDSLTRRGMCRVLTTDCSSFCLMRIKPSSTSPYRVQVSAGRSTRRRSFFGSSPTERIALRYLVVPNYSKLNDRCHDRMYDHLSPTQTCVAGNGGVGSPEDNVPPLWWCRFLAKGSAEIVSSKRSRG